MAEQIESPWSLDDHDLLGRLHTTPDGLTSTEAARRLADAPPPLGVRRSTDLELLVRQFRSPILWLLVAAAVLSAVLGETTDAAIIAVIVAASGVLGFVQERGAVRDVEALLGTVRVHAHVHRDGALVEVALTDVVPGDVVELAAGDVVPGDGRVLAANALLVDESALTGEAYPRRKRPGSVAADAALVARTDMVHLGTHVVSGEGAVVMVATGSATELGRVSEHLDTQHVPTSFERGITAFGFLLLRATGALVVAIFVVNLVLHRPVVESLLFSLALAVGLTPQMLPAIVTLSLSRGAAAMAERRVIVKRLDAIEDIGSLDVLCTDKTGTLTTGAVGLDAALAPDGTPSPRVARLAWWNAHHQTGFANPIDDAIRATDPPADTGERLGEVPYDFTRKRLSIAVHTGDGTLLVTKGAFEQVLACCPDADADGARRHFAELSAQGFRVLGIAHRDLDPVPGDAAPGALTADDERDLVFDGFLTFSDPPKPGAREAIARLVAAQVSVRLITGDNRLAAAHIGAAMGLPTDDVLVGAQLGALDDAALAERVEQVAVFAEIEPIHKERIVRALSAGGHTVGFLGDGINDAPALHVADVGISVDTAVDVAKQTADLVLLDKDLGVLGDGIEAGRRVFANTLKYVYVTTSANFGNMLSMAAVAALLPYLPLLPTQILLLNFLSDVPGTTIATDRVDPEQLGTPHRWHIRRVRDFMLVFGVISTLFDLLTFAVLRLGFDASATAFRSGWFVESTVTELAVMLVLRTRRACLRSRPSTALAMSSAIVLAITLAVPYSPVAGALGLDGPPATVLAALAAITVGYVIVTESIKKLFPRLLD
jgi:Mg2+-importing ATPase